MAFVLAIDGPAGSGKSTTASGCALRLGFSYLDTGAMYRAVTLKLMKSGVQYTAAACFSSSRRSVALLARVLARTRIDLEWHRGRLQVRLDGSDVTAAIREPRVNARVSEVSALKVVRAKMVGEQRRIGRGQDLVCEGRDIGSVVFPNADLKVFMDCDLAQRAGRRKSELRALGSRTSRKVVSDNLRERDRTDSGRAASPLVRVPDAVLIDTSDLTIDEQVEIVCALVRQRAAAKRRRQ